MKTLLYLFCAAAIIAMTTGCDPMFSYSFEIANDTQSEIIVKIGDSKQVAIHSGYKEVIYTDGHLGGVRDPIDFVASSKQPIIINDKLISSDDFWRKEYWEEGEKKGKLHFTYKMTLNDKMLERILSGGDNNTL